MDREIKYRAWDKLNENMHEVSRLSFSRDDSERITVDSKIFENDTRFLTSKNSVLMQYTGLKDKNGVEIYEGDEIKGTYPNGNEFDGVVRYSTERAEYEVETNRSWIPSSLSVCSDFEVIGNIYEHNNLLEEPK